MVVNVPNPTGEYLEFIENLNTGQTSDCLEAYG
jgi:hypothetical protein